MSYLEHCDDNWIFVLSPIFENEKIEYVNKNCCQHLGYSSRHKRSIGFSVDMRPA